MGDIILYKESAMSIRGRWRVEEKSESLTDIFKKKLCRLYWMRNLIRQVLYKFGNSKKRWKKEAICDRINKRTKADYRLKFVIRVRGKV